MGKIGGDGSFEWPNGDKFEGKWVDGRRWGKGNIHKTQTANFAAEVMIILL